MVCLHCFILIEPAGPFITPLEILPEWYFIPVFQIHRKVAKKLSENSTGETKFS